MPWRVVEVSVQEPNGSNLTDVELIKMYEALVTTHKELANKFKAAVEHAKQNLHSLHRWEDEGGK